MAVSRPDGLPLHKGEFDYAQTVTPTFTGDTGRVHVALATFNHKDPDFVFDPLSTYWRLPSGIDFHMLGTVVIAGPTRDTIEVLVPDCIVPPEGPDIKIDLRHVVTLRLGPAVDMGHNLSPLDLALALCPNSLAPTLGLHRWAYWEEVNPLLQEWTKVNNTKCPECDRLICVNMSRHLRLMHTAHMCYWRCPIPDCPLWFRSELNGKDHIERTHRFREWRGHSFYECLCEFGLEWFRSRTFFDQQKSATQAIWMDLALARQSGQELRNTYTITGSPDFAPLRRFFRSAVIQLQLLYNELPVASFQPPLSPTRYYLTMRAAVGSCNTSSSEDSLLLLSPAVRQLTSANRSLCFLESGTPGAS